MAMATSCHHLFRYKNTTKKKRWHIAIIFFFFATPPQKKRWHIVVVFFFSNIEKIRHTRKQQKKTKRREGPYLQVPVVPFSLLVPASTLPLLHFRFKFFLLTFSSFQAKEKKRKTQREKKMKKKKKSLPWSSYYALSLLTLAFAFLLLPFRFKCFFSTSSSS